MARILIWPAGREDPIGSGKTDDATSQYRLLFPAQCLKAEGGVDIKVSWRGPTVLWSERWDATKHSQPPLHVVPMALARKPEADVVVMQRPNAWWWAQIIPMLQALDIRVVVDVDDAFDAIHPKNLAYKVNDPRRNELKNYEWMLKACERADLVTTSTPYLNRRFGFGHGVVLPNRVPDHYLEIPRDPIEHSIGWTGSIESHPTDLRAALKVCDTHYDEMYPSEIDEIPADVFPPGVTPPGQDTRIVTPQ